MEKRGAIGLSINVLVVVIISLVILGFGIYLLYQFIGGAEDIKQNLDQRTKLELERLLVNLGEGVALPLHQATVSRGETHVFGIGVLNIGGVGDKFHLEITPPEKYVDEQGEIQNVNQVANQDLMTWLLYNDVEDMLIKEGEHQTGSILVIVPDDAPTGEYIFTARILDEGGNRYGNPQKFIVVVR